MPIKSKRASSSENVLQRIYEEAYRTFVDAMFEDGRGNGAAALDGWLNTLELIENEHSKIVACPQVSSLDITLYARIVDIERQSKDRVYAYAATFSGNTLNSAELTAVYEQLRADRRKMQKEQPKMKPSSKQTLRGKHLIIRPEGPLRSLSAGDTVSSSPDILRSQSPPKKSMLMTLRGPKNSKKDKSSTTTNHLAVPATTAANLAWTSSGTSANTSRRSSENKDDEGYLMQTAFKNFSSPSLPSIQSTSTAATAAVTTASANTVPDQQQNNSMGLLFGDECQPPLIALSPARTPPKLSSEIDPHRQQVVRSPPPSRSPSPTTKPIAGYNGQPTRPSPPQRIATPNQPWLPPHTVSANQKLNTTGTAMVIDTDTVKTQPSGDRPTGQGPWLEACQTTPTKPSKFARRKMPLTNSAMASPTDATTSLPPLKTASTVPLPSHSAPQPPSKASAELPRVSTSFGSPGAPSSHMPSISADIPTPFAESLTLPRSTFPFLQQAAKSSAVASSKRTLRDAQPTKNRQGSRTSPSPTAITAGGNPLSAALAATAKEDKKDKERKQHQPYGLTSTVSSQSDVGNRVHAAGSKTKVPVVSPQAQRRQRQIGVAMSYPTSNATIPSAPLQDMMPDTSDPEQQAWNDRVNAALKKITGVEESAARQILNEIIVKGDEVHWDDIAGLEQAKTSLKETVVYPFLRPDLFKGLREPARGMLLFGPPGTGKTMLARAVATESQSTFFAISASSLTSKYLGESEKLVRALFALARALAPSIIFVDEIDSLLSTRNDTGEHEASRRIKTEFLVKWSDLAHAAAGKEHKDGDDAQRVLVLAATNIPWAIDEAARRRFVRRQYIPLPEPETRLKQIQSLLNYQVHDLSEAEIQQLVALTDGFSGSDITAVAKDAAMGPLRALGDALLSTPRDQIRPVKFIDFEASLKNIRPSVSKEGLRAFDDWALKYGSSGA
ncbi:hypothetical protein V1509DRAFT_651103 [Lipomyces kononenkoae]